MIILVLGKFYKTKKPKEGYAASGNESCKGGHRQNFGKNWNYWVKSVAISKENKKGCYYTEISTCSNTSWNGLILENISVGWFELDSQKLNPGHN